MADAPTTDDINLRVLQRHNPEVTSIVSIAPFAVIYTFSAESQTWEKSGVEGSLFVCSLQKLYEDGPERFNVMLLNRRSLENFELELFHESDVEVADEFIIVQGDETIFGLWIFEEKPPSSTANMRETQAKVIRECASRAEQGLRTAQQDQPVPPAPPNTLRQSDSTYYRPSAYEQNEGSMNQHRANLLAQFQQPPGSRDQQASHDSNQQQQQGTLADLFSRARTNFEASRM